MTLQELGQSLKEQREAVGLSLDDIAARIKISTRILRSIEEGSMVGMPHAVYTKRFIRSFGGVIGYDPDDLNAKLDIVFPPEALEETRNDYGILNRIEPPAYGGLKRVVGLLFVLAVFVGLAAGGWFVAKTYGDDIWRLIKQPFSAVSTPAANRTEAVAVPPAPPDNAASGAAIPRAAEAASPAATLPGAPQADYRMEQPAAPSYPPAAPAAPGAAAPAGSSFPARPPSVPEQPAAVSSVAPAAGAMQQVLITAREECWLSARADGAKGRDYTLRPGESFVLTYTNNLDLALGNAGGVSIINNGRNLGRPGAPGQRVDLHFPMPGN